VRQGDIKVEEKGGGDGSLDRKKNQKQQVKSGKQNGSEYLLNMDLKEGNREV